jgi:RimJ/RimL family protein N-acetyltransferase
MHTIIFLENEFNVSMLPESVTRSYEIVPVRFEAATTENEIEPALRRALSEKEKEFAAEEVLFIASTDSSIRAAKNLGLAVAAYANPLFPGQKFEGVGMVIEGFDEVDDVFLDRIYRRERGLPWEIAQTKRCIIREIALSDLPELIRLYEQNNDFVEPLLPPEEERIYEENYIANMYGYYGYGMWLITEKTTGKVIGRAGLEHRDFDGVTELELGYLIASEWRKKGIAYEVCREIISYAKDNLGFQRINAVVDPKNTASLALLEKLNFTYLEDISIQNRIMKRYVLLFTKKS